MSGDQKVELNKTIAEYAAAFNKLKPSQRTESKALQIFNLLNAAKTGNSKDLLDDADKIDKFFKDVMGLTVMHNISKDEFLENIEDWAVELAKYEAPKKEGANPKTPIKRISGTDASNLAEKLFKAARPDCGNTWMADIFAWGNGDDARWERTKVLFNDDGDVKTTINKHNIVEVLDNLDLEEFRYAIYTLDGDKERIILRTIKRMLQERIDSLKNAGIAVPDAAQAGLNDIKIESTRGKRTEFANAVTTCVNALRGLGVAEK